METHTRLLAVCEVLTGQARDKAAAEMSLGSQTPVITWCPRADSNCRTRFRKPMLYPLSYGSGTSARSSA